MSKLMLGGVVLLALGACVDTTETPPDSVARHADHLDHLRNDVPFRNASGEGATFSTAGYIDLDNDFFADLGTNGRTCGTCHRPESGWTFTPAVAREIFERTNGHDPLFHNNDGTNSPFADTSTRHARWQASSMLLTKGLIRVGIGIPDGADFELADVDDPYGYASAAELSLFRRPLPSMNLSALSTVMWDGRETLVDTATPPRADSNCLQPPFASTCFLAVDPYDLASQALDATLGHAQAMVPGLTEDQLQRIVEFEAGLMFAQVRDDDAGRLDRQGANGGPDALPTFPSYFGINDTFGDYQTHQPFTNFVFDLYEAWADLPSDHHHHMDASDCDHGHDHGHGHDRGRDDHGGSNDARLAVARGEAIFNSRPFTISGVTGLNGAVGLPAAFSGTCSTCHNSPDAGSHTIPLPIDLGVSAGTRRTPDLPLYTLRCSALGVSRGHCSPGQTHETTDPGRALITGNWGDLDKFKGPTLRGLAARAPYFHNGSAASLAEVVDFYDTRFDIGLSHRDKADLVAFLRTL